ncbi:phosphoglycerol transferase MdoB-like AlkP superfamily enzyme [Dyadobacter sp. BE34]|uniref:Phosphoglycerol transferase MdoB-like AlkP superfamily enzyme n=1 Tax=Dyadobacter fermentans TaxID=94254 RepID=A0ABU1R0N2_9BACT|nr:MULTISPECIES: LTA synthase family protein [Dyadobacter]MDR6806454.1 phosphoglycerol transferase MdoB-like AlkP superfamily enzyme [Dyadobacter fermentans]MDR7044195.1 phosphoglycerol transferase MdoB-like AlkP superfamily enzyme [Dyadobacter sp. BE242]MDR7198506.1 phosphoglycerol transferase MdoB-like AlkP superfamily enzyme [Dyadobacter sp. BE34]MDR7216468.1 phosphoglycerol transferase MdoB-like AlkP superfamily enzyme [Dyadobacter sp. BE31]MDR7264006.1 phosphoglycerol transferase MdoB-lik
MRKRLEFVALYGLAWVLIFQFFRVIFLAYHYKKALELPSSLWVASAGHGLPMDISFASYILAIPTLLLMFTGQRWDWYRKTLSVYTAIIVSLITLLTVVDLELFRAWGFRIDATSLHYLETPAEAFASMGAAPVWQLILLLIVLIFLINRVLQTIIRRTTASFRPSPLLYTIPLFLVIAGSLIVPIRGGFQLAPMNESAVFFSDKSFANYAAVNVPWNYMRSVLNEAYSDENPFKYADDTEASRKVTSLYSRIGGTQQVIDTVGKKNVLVIIWESFTAKAVGSLGGLKNITPQFDQIAKEGLLFTNVYASGNRSDKGMVAILSGYPAQPTTSIIKIPKKTASLPSLPTIFKTNGWQTSFYYGGETEFANMKSYFLQQGFDRIVDINDFDSKDMNSKWGAHDHVVFKRLMHDLDQEKQPFFTTMFTLSSHEPFEVPTKTVIAGNDPEHLFLNALHYTDESLGAFLREAQTKPWWKNTLVVIIADHGHPLPETRKDKPSEFHIPMLWLGGALATEPSRVDTLASQTDLAATILNQMHLPSGTFAWSNDIFKKGRQDFAYFAFNNGLGWMRPDGFIVRDNIGGNITEKSGALLPQEEDLSKAYLQSSFGDYLKR